MKYVLKGFLCFLLMLLPSVISSSKTIRISEKNFPDTFFRTYIEEKFDGNHNGKLDEKERSKVKSISVGEYSDYQLEYEYPPVETVEGIEYFPNLRYLDVSGCMLTQLDVSHNRKLNSLNCKMNELKKLDISKNEKLVSLICEQNKLKELSLNSSPKLQFLLCGSNNLKKINLKRNKKIEVLSVENNKLKKLNVQELRNLQSLTCSSNKITHLNLKFNKKLDILYCTGNKLKKLHLRKNHLLQYLYCQDNQLITGNCYLARSQLSNCETSKQKQTIRIKKIGKHYYIPLKGVNKTNVITNLSAGTITDRGIRLKGKKVPKKITYEYNMFTDGEERTKVEIKVKKEKRKNRK